MQCLQEAFSLRRDSKILRAVTRGLAQLPHTPQIGVSYEVLLARHFNSNKIPFPKCQSCCCLHYNYRSCCFDSSCLLGLHCVNQGCREKLLQFSLPSIWVWASVEVFVWLTSSPESNSFFSLQLLLFLLVYTAPKDSNICTCH